jgi:hypothetical protein
MEDVLNQETSAPVVPGKGQDGKGKDDGKVTLSQAEFDSLKRERDEARDSERYWAGMARNNGGRQQEPVRRDKQRPRPERIRRRRRGKRRAGRRHPEKLVDDFAAQGVKALSKRGFITAKDAMRIASETALKVSREMIGRERQKITSDTQIMTDFPDLKDPNSELFKETAKNYQQAVAMDPNAKKTPVALYLAAKAARESLKAKNAPQQRRRNDDDYDEDARESEDDRRARSDSQDSRPRGRGTVNDSDDMLGNEAREVIRQMGITEEEFKASQKATMGGGRSGGRGRR